MRAHQLCDAFGTGRTHRIAQRFGELPRRLKARCLIALKRLGDGVGHLTRHVRTQRIEARHGHAHHHVERLRGVVALEEPLAGDRLPGADAHRENVCAPIDILAPHLLRREVANLALHLAALRVRGALKGTRNTEIRDADATRDIDEDILR